MKLIEALTKDKEIRTPETEALVRESDARWAEFSSYVDSVRPNPAAAKQLERLWYLAWMKQLKARNLYIPRGPRP